MRVLIVDGNNLLWRSYEALPKFRTSKGHPTGASYGFVRSLWSQVDKFKATHGVIAFDAAGSNAVRRKIDPKYKSDRDVTLDRDFLIQQDDVRRICQSAGFTVLQDSVCEADDLVGAVIDHVLKDDRLEAVRILSVDHDMMQCLVDDRIELLRPVPQKGDEYWTRTKVIRTFGIEPSRLPELWALCGDPGDCVPSIFGRMHAEEILQGYGSLEAYVRSLSQSSEKKDADRIRKNFQLVKRIEWYGQYTLGRIHWEDARSEFMEFEFKSFLKRIPEQPSIANPALAVE